VLRLRSRLALGDAKKYAGGSSSCDPRGGIPYAVAIAAGALIAMALQR